MYKTLSMFASRLTGSSFRPDNQRVQVDSGQTSFEENLQFKFFDEYHENALDDPISINDHIVYKFETTVPVNIQIVSLELWEGTRSCQFYRDEGITFTGTLVSQNAKISNENENVNKYLETHPDHQVSISRFVGVSDFSSTNPPVDGIAVRVANSANQQITTFSQSGERWGIAANTAVYFVLKNIAGNDDTQGMFKITWEEIQ